MNTEILAGIFTELRSKRPLVQAITNYVTINDCANILLSLGASPAMCEARDEVEEFAAVADAVYLNIGTLTAEQKEAMLIAAASAARAGKPVVLDPVAVGGIRRKSEFINQLLTAHKAAIIKGNTGEIKSMAGFDGEVRGVDSADDGANIIEACIKLAREYDTVAVATGMIDTISDGTRTVQIQNGHPGLTMITGTGCMLGAMTAAAAAVEKDFFQAACTAVLAMGIAGEMAALGMDQILPGTYRARLFDSIYQLSEEDFIKAGKLTWI